MKKIFILFLTSLAIGVNLSAQINPVFLEKIYGNAEENRPTVIKAFNDGIYVAGYKVVGVDEFATFTKFNLSTGALVWEKCFELHTRITDFDYEPTQDELFIVGQTSPFSNTFDNASFLARISGNGNLMVFQRYTQNGRERFDRIVRHPNPCNPNAPFYIAGIKNPTSTPSAFDIVVLFNVDLNGNLLWGNEYTISPVDNEFSRGLIPYGSNLILFGNDIANNGVLLHVNCTNNGTVLNSFTYPGSLDIYDGLELQNGFIAMVGEDFSVNEGFVEVLNLGFLPAGSGAGLRFQNIIRFNDLWTDQFGKLYVIGENKNLTPQHPKNYQVVHKINNFIHAGLASLSVDWARYLEDPAETNYGTGVISVTPAFNRIFYADARLNNPSGFGNWDMLIGSFDLDLNSTCRVDFPFPTTAFTPSPNAVAVAVAPVNPFPNLSFPPIIQNCMFGCNNFCAAPDPCPCDFTWTTGNCFQVFFDASCPNPIPGNYTYEWDFDCSGGPPDQVTNNAIISHTFPCGGNTYQVCLKITDPFGTQCTVMHTVVVPSTCCGQASGVLDCTFTPDLYTYTITVTDPLNSGACNYVLTTPLPGILNSPINYNTFTGGATITGTISVNTAIIPLALNFTVQISCICPGTGLPYTCTLPVSVATKCCKSIEVPDQIVCETDATLDVPLLPANGVSLNNISQVTWFVMPKPPGGCPTTPWGGTPFQNNYTNVLEPLHLFPVSTFSGDLCVYAVLYLNDGPCKVLTSNIAMVQFCAPSTCSLNEYSYCYTGTPIVPGLLTLTLNTPPNACPPNIDWFDPAGNLVDNGPGPFQPVSGLSMTNPLVDCYEDFYYTVVITDACGQRDCRARVRLYSDDAPKGSLAVVPLEPLPLCYGGDATLQFTPGCSGRPPGPPSWTWCESTDGSTWQPLPAGTLSLYWNTNPLIQDTWYSVKSTNGDCPEDNVQLKIDVRDPLQITSFMAQYDDPCDPTGVYMEVQFSPQPPDPPCNVTVEWYKDGVLIQTTPPAAPSPASYTYFTGGGPSLAGNYYCVIKNDCCDERDTSMVVQIAAPCFALVIGPCFICDNGPVNLDGIIVNMPTGTSCTYLWTTSNGTFSGPTTNATVTVTSPGLYVFTALCMDINGVICTKTAYFDLLGCSGSSQFAATECAVISTDEIQLQSSIPVRIFPNPTTGDITVEWTSEAPKGSRLFITDPMGRKLRTLIVPDAASSLSIQLNDLPSGLYFVKIQSADRLYHVAKVVKE